MTQPLSLILRHTDALTHSIRHLEIPQETCWATLQFIVKALGVKIIAVRQNPLTFEPLNLLSPEKTFS
jgi:hypothetical protein